MKHRAVTLIKLLRKQSGWSLLEAMIAITVFTILGLALTTLYATGDELLQIKQNKMSLQSEARMSMDRVLKELRLARPSSVTVGGNQDSITFQIPSSINTSSGAIVWSGQITYSVGGINNAQLIRTETGQIDVIMANDVNTTAGDPNRLQFVPDQTPNPNLITVTLGLQRNTNKGHAATTALTGQVRVRNP